MVMLGDGSDILRHPLAPARDGAAGCRHRCTAETRAHGMDSDEPRRPNGRIYPTVNSRSNNHVPLVGRSAQKAADLLRFESG